MSAATAIPTGLPSDLDSDRELLRRAVAEAGAEALRHFRAAGRRWEKSPGQVVTEADLAIDDLLHAALLGARPDDGWLSEERPDDGSRHVRERVWVVDPIDGTRAFADGVPEFAVSVALVVAGRPMLGAVYNPASGELFEAGAGGGAWLNGTRIRASRRAELAGAKLVSSRGEMRHRRWPELIPEAAGFTAVGSLAYKLALVAGGRFDGFVSLRRTADWDVAAALLLVTEAGGRISLADGAPLRLNRPEPHHAGLGAGAAPGLHADLVARLRPHLG